MAFNIVALRKSLKINQREFAKRFDISQSYLSEIESGRRPVTFAMEKKLRAAIGDALDEFYEEDDHSPVPADLIPDLPVDAAAGFTEDLESGVTPEMCRMLPKLPGIGDYDLTITVRGNSMEPAFSAGDRLAIRRCRDVVEWGAPHVVDCEDGVYIKRVEDQGEAILCSSDNPLYKPFPIPKPTIRALYKVIALFRTY